MKLINNIIDDNILKMRLGVNRFGHKVIPIFFLVTMITFQIFAGKDRLESYQKHLEMKKDSIFKILRWKSIGPYAYGGRVVDIEGYENDPFSFLVASASGGLWKTTNNGITWISLFEGEACISIGDIAVSQSNKNLIWIGTGEINGSRSTMAGIGVYKSTNGGMTWNNMGLADTFHIGRVIIDPIDNETIYIAALGHLYSENDSRGVFKTTDGGKTWEKILFINAKTGVADLVIHPRNREILWAAAWEKSFKAWNYIKGGKASGIYKTTNGGKTWKKLTKGFPETPNIGRIGLSISPSNPNTIYALVDNQEPKPSKFTKELSIAKFGEMGVEQFLKIDNDSMNGFLKKQGVSEFYHATLLKRLVQSGEFTPKTLVTLIFDATKRRRNTNIIGAEVYKSLSGGEEWVKINQTSLDSMYYTYGFYFGQIRVSPKDAKVVFILGVDLQKSIDGGKTFKSIPKSGRVFGINVLHRDHHAMWINPEQSNKILLGNDGGVNISYDEGQSWQKIMNLSIAQCYTLQYDMRQPYCIYTGLQDNGVVMGSSQYKYGDLRGIWRKLLGADGAFVEVSRIDPSIIYAESQYGSLYRLDLNRNQKTYLQPQPQDLSTKYRWNWLTPFISSQHHTQTLYMGANFLLKSTDQGRTWEKISGDLTNNHKTTGSEPYATITAITEAPSNPNILYVGTDDGNLWLTKDGGNQWTKINQVLPKKWINGVVASKHDTQRVYVTLTGYWEDDFRSYIFMSHNFGRDWESLTSNLPEEPVNVLREDPMNPHQLYLGTNRGVFVSLNGGRYWYSLKNNLPSVPVFDLKIHPRENDLIIGTHGRGVFLLPIKIIQQLSPEMVIKPVFLLKFDPISVNKEKIRVNYYTHASGIVRLHIKNRRGVILKTARFEANRGLNQWEWDLHLNKKQKIKKGTYSISLKKGKYKTQQMIQLVD